VPLFNRRVQEMGSTEFYKAAGDLTLAYLKVDRQLLV